MNEVISYLGGFSVTIESNSFPSHSTQVKGNIGLQRLVIRASQWVIGLNGRSYRFREIYKINAFPFVSFYGITMIKVVLIDKFFRSFKFFRVRSIKITSNKYGGIIVQERQLIYVFSKGLVDRFFFLLRGNIDSHNNLMSLVSLKSNCINVGISCGNLRALKLLVNEYGNASSSVVLSAFEKVLVSNIESLSFIVIKSGFRDYCRMKRLS